MTQFMQGGIFMWFILIFAVVNLVLTIKKVIQLFGGTDSSPKQAESGINAILFWGSMSVVVGFYAHFLGLFFAMQAISQAGDVSPAIVAKGFGVSLIPVLFGLVVFFFSALVWFLFRWRLKKLTGGQGS